MPYKDKPNTNEHKGSRPFDKLAALMGATYQTRGESDNPEALKAILDSMKESNTESNE